MSNMIKAYSVRYDDVTKMTIDTHLRIDRKIEETRSAVIHTTITASDGFVEGLNAVIIETVPSIEEIKEKHSKVMEEAQVEAKKIIEQAKKDTELMKKEAYSSAQKKGFDDGMLQVKKEAQKLKAEFDEKDRRLQEEFEAKLETLEPQMVQLVSALVEKVTGIVVQDKEEVIFYLISKAIKNMDKSDEYTLRVSEDDYEYVSTRKNLLLGAIGREVPLYIKEDANLMKNQCLIETEFKVINCSLDIQLSNLITNLKLIAGI